jgi:type II secretory pathway pseudopilin PulG
MNCPACGKSNLDDAQYCFNCGGTFKTSDTPRKGKKFGIVIVFAAAGCVFFITGILAIIAAILIPNFIRARTQAQMAASISNEKNIAAALDMYQTNHHGKFPDTGGRFVPLNSLQNGLVPRYMRGLPVDPAAGAEYTYSGSNHPAQFTICDPSASSYNLKSLCFSSSSGLRIQR